jgi:aspartate kinase
MKPIVVQKYGGSSVADIDRLRRVAKRVVETVECGNRVVVVISAMGRTTDELLKLAQSAAARPPRRELDMLLSAGERMASALLAMAISDLGHDAISFTGSQCGIITNDRHTDARILEVRPYRVQDELDRGRVVTIAGYQGVSYRRDVTTLGRGGSDTTAVAMAAALGAAYCEILSDVDGVYSADPRVVQDPVHLACIDYDEMSELSHYGAKVLNPQAVEFARRAGIVIHAGAASGSDRVTLVGRSDGQRGIIGVAGLSQLTSISGSGGAEQLAQLSELLLRFDVRPLWARLEQGRPVFLLQDSLSMGSEALLLDLRARDDLTVETSLELASVVGLGLSDVPDLIAVVTELCKRHGLPLRGLDLGPLRLSLLLPEGHLPRALELLHQEFIKAVPHASPEDRCSRIPPIGSTPSDE